MFYIAKKEQPTKEPFGLGCYTWFEGDTPNRVPLPCDLQDNVVEALTKICGFTWGHNLTKFCPEAMVKNGWRSPSNLKVCYNKNRTNFTLWRNANFRVCVVG